MDAITPISLSLGVKAKELSYQKQDCALTLREGLDEYYVANSGLFDPKNTSTEILSGYFRNHDVSHVIFGTTTSVSDEALQDMWTFLAVDVTKKEYIFNFIDTDESKQLMQSLDLWETVKAIARMIGMMPLLIWRSRKMTKKWPWNDWTSYLDRPLSEICNEFNIRVF
ncbi:MAG: hypothetical protein AAGA80_28375 [Cyanobacteria bacterium P01_F01_bin.143]